MTPLPPRPQFLHRVLVHSVLRLHKPPQFIRITHAVLASHSLTLSALFEPSPFLSIFPLLLLCVLCALCALCVERLSTFDFRLSNFDLPFSFSIFRSLMIECSVHEQAFDPRPLPSLRPCRTERPSPRVATISRTHANTHLAGRAPRPAARERPGGRRNRNEP